MSSAARGCTGSPEPTDAALGKGGVPVQLDKEAPPAPCAPFPGPAPDGQSGAGGRRVNRRPPPPLRQPRRGGERCGAAASGRQGAAAHRGAHGGGVAEAPPAGAGRQRGARGGAGGGGVILNRGFSELGVGGGTVRRASVRAGVGRPARSAGKDGLARGVLAGERRVCGTRASWVGACFWEPSKRERGGKGKRKHYTKAPEACSAGSFYVRKMC